MILSNNFESTSDNLHLENWESLSQKFLDSLKDGDLLLETEWSILIKDHTEDMFPLDDCNALLDHVTAHSVKNHLEELIIVVKFKCHHELWLEVLPDLVVLLSLSAFLKNYRILQVFVKVFCIFPMLPELVNLDVPFIGDTLLAYFEHLLFLVEVYVIIITYFFHQEFKWARSC